MIYRTFLSIRAKSFWRSARSSFRQRWLETAVPVIIVVGILVGGYHLLLTGARFLLSQGEIGVLLLDRFFFLGWSIIFYLLILSNILTSLSTLYRSPEVSFFLTKPVAYVQLFKFKLFENLVYSSWAILLLGIPLTLAYGQVKALSFGAIAGFLPLALLPFLLIAAAIGLVLIQIVVHLSRWFQMRSVFLALAGIFALVFYLYFKFNQQDTILVGMSGNFRVLSRYMGNLSTQPFAFIPSYWLSEMIVNFAQRDWSGLAFFLALMVTTALVFFECSAWFATKMYFSSYQVMEGVNARRQRLSFRAISDRSLFRRLPSQYRALVIKDILQFVRTPQQWIQFLMFAFFIAIYLINLSRTDIRLEDMDPFWQTLIYIFNFGFSGFMLAALTSRFVYPLISLEGPGLWILLSAPMNLSRVFQVKFWMSFTLFFTLSEIVALLGNYYLGQDQAMATISTLFLLVMSLGLVSISLGLGAVFPRFDETNPMRISSGAGGIITVLASLLYVGIMVGGMVLVYKLWLSGGWSTQLAGLIGTVGLISLVIVYLPLKWGHRVLLKTHA
ncbi:MAG: hypothetical protein ACE5D8_04165 [Fidelibacterota bacterium]